MVPGAKDALNYHVAVLALLTDCRTFSEFDPETVAVERAFLVLTVEIDAIALELEVQIPANTHLFPVKHFGASEQLDHRHFIDTCAGLTRQTALKEQRVGRGLSGRSARRD